MAFSLLNPYQYLAVYFDFFYWTSNAIFKYVLGLAAARPSARASKGILHTIIYSFHCAFNLKIASSSISTKRLDFESIA